MISRGCCPISHGGSPRGLIEGASGSALPLLADLVVFCGLTLHSAPDIRFPRWKKETINKNPRTSVSTGTWGSPIEHCSIPLGRHSGENEFERNQQISVDYKHQDDCRRFIVMRQVAVPPLDRVNGMRNTETHQEEEQQRIWRYCCSTILLKNTQTQIHAYCSEEGTVLLGCSTSTSEGNAAVRVELAIYRLESGERVGNIENCLCVRVCVRGHPIYELDLFMALERL